MPLLLTAGEALVDVALPELAIHRDPVERSVHILEPAAQLRGLAIERGLGGSQEVGHRDTRNLDGILHGQEQPGPRPRVNRHAEYVHAVESHRAAGDGILRVTRYGVGKGRLARAVRTHDRVRLTGAHREVDAAQDLLRAAIGVDRDMQVADLQGCHRLSRLRCYGLRRSNFEARLFRGIVGCRHRRRRRLRRPCRGRQPPARLPAG